MLGYCEKGLDCEHQHVRECPDFAEKGVCTTKGCKLPHVIRANRNRPKGDAVPSTASTASETGTREAGTTESESAVRLYAEDAQLGDEYISLTFHESESEEEEDEEDEEEEEAAAPSDDIVPEVDN